MLICKVLGLMCDGQFRVMQDYTREQSEDTHSVNIVAEMSTFLYHFSKKQEINEESLQLLNHLLQALIEFCTGNYKNREVIFYENIISAINYVLQIDITHIKAAEAMNGADQEKCIDVSMDYIYLRRMALEMKGSAMQLLESMLEDISIKTTKLSYQIAEGLDIHALHWSMLDFYILKSDPDLIRLQSEDNACRGLFDGYRIIMHLVDSGASSLESLSKYNNLRWTACIIMRGRGQLHGILSTVLFTRNLCEKCEIFHMLTYNLLDPNGNFFLAWKTVEPVYKGPGDGYYFVYYAEVER